MMNSANRTGGPSRPQLLQLALSCVSKRGIAPLHFLSEKVLIIRVTII
jgi:hypothetical protein